MKAHVLLLSYLFLCHLIFAQDNTTIKKEYEATRVETSPIIDGFLDDEVWLQKPVADDFTQAAPNPLAPSAYRSEIKMVYNDEFVYIGAMLYDNAPDSILKQLTQRDDLGNSDWFGVVLNPYMDGINGVGFIVSAAGVQFDTQYSINNEDANWNAVWRSAVQIHEKGWSIEMAIPYSALRFPDKVEQEWGVNFIRTVRRTRERAWWNPYDPNKNGFLNQAGKVVGIRNVQSPIRLFLYPYVSAQVEHNNFDGGSNWSNAFNAGMDIKYGINEAFTLDMTLIPDFGQVQSDNQVLNLSPFEVQFDENRQFFTEGTELFNKANLLYSRRIGGNPFDDSEVYELEEQGYNVIDNPSTVQLLNSTKISGRTNKGLGIGFFNSFTNTTYATLEDQDGQTKLVKTSPFTNYNVTVLDQNFKNNSYFSLINTNVFRDGEAYEANVTGTEFQFNDKSNTWSFDGDGAVSQKYFSPDNQDIGYRYQLSFGKVSGTFQYGTSFSASSDNYDQNDLGFFTRNNFMVNSLYANYNYIKPFGNFQRFGVGLYTFIDQRFIPRSFQSSGINLNTWFITKGFFAFGVSGFANYADINDYFEPRSEGRFLVVPRNDRFNAWLSSDYRKKFALDLRFNYRTFEQDNRNSYFITIEPRYRFNDKLSMVLESEVGKRFSNIGWVNALDNGDIIMGERNITNVENVFNIDYIFNNLMGLTFRLRHNWTDVVYQKYHLLEEDGLLGTTTYNGLDESTNESLHNTNFNAFNIDMVYRWQFAPGSELTAVWKNAVFDFNRDIDQGYFYNLEETLQGEQTNNFSIKILYFVDYLNLRATANDWF